MSELSFEIKRLDHLGLVAGFCKAIGLEEIINQKLPKSSHHLTLVAHARSSTSPSNGEVNALTNL